ncbi:HAD family hydrolase [Nocardiopsis tropica]|uniref:HAD family hydrolase n=1 Tax=Nocardiopsis tropica TaxID=109330 RepID=A0ABV1ZY94_9ACTN
MRDVSANPPPQEPFPSSTDHRTDERAGAFTAVLVDWRGTLAVTLSPEQWITTALEEVGRPASPVDAVPILARLDAVNADERLLSPGMDADPALHRRVFMEVLADAGLDHELAEALYRVESDPGHDRFAEDALPFLARARASGVRTVIVSDIHVDIRPRFDSAGLGAYVDAYALSCEQGAEKPDPRLFEAALRMAGARPDEALMVGDRHTHDGVAVALGITTLILPPLRDESDRRLNLAEALLYRHTRQV